ncbi:hypothetical protein CXF68_04575 [Tenacibaculum sp. Bg11-29]|uniref:retropepsin-like aspartic protease n=1 Tax=Tenacibaculum sp. Bg11-29 TaxID=2058306 RepID=UPI000C349625|nr:retropepsin-like aspartic protease [Tenacibaculum sp. Bg11-29]PKH50023.1 hypothetical protein CXF68_04575 [Tenacibaculum sp. Bg11-29]
MKFKKVLYLVFLLIVLSSCAGAKIRKILKVGEVAQKNYKVTFPFEYTKTGHILIKATIKGEIYDFILDTGATNIISNELAEKLKVVTIGSSKISDINEKSTSLAYVKLDDIAIGGINFKGTIGSILDLKKGDLACLEVDGLIGSNLMRHAVWDFDFQNKMITITDNEKTLNIPSNYSESKIFVGDAYQVSIITKVNEERVLNNVIDLGNPGCTKLRYKVFKEQKESKRIKKYIKGSGGSGFGAFGRSIEKRNSYLARINKFRIGDYFINNAIVSVEDENTNIGLGFLKNYRVIFNWKTKKFKMIKQRNKDKGNIITFGFKSTFEKNKLYIDYLYDNIKASKILKYRDQILSINNKDYSYVSDSQWCEIFQMGLLKNLKINKIKIKVLRDGEELEFDLEKVKLL